jgi:hypothetical protein
MHRQGGPTAFAGNRCFNFERKPDPDPAQCRTRGFVTIWQNGKIIWEGTEGQEPAEFQRGFGLSSVRIGQPQMMNRLALRLT